MRVRRALTNGWQMAPELDGPAVVDPRTPAPPETGWRPVTVPGYWQAQFPELARATGPVWYRISFEADSSWFNYDSLRLYFGAVGHFCQGWLNGRYVGDHEGGHLPFCWSVDDTLRRGHNDLLIRIVSPSGDRARYAAFPFEEILHGKQSWYGPAGGIWQEVAIEARSALAVRSLFVRPDVERAAVELKVDLGSSPDTAEVRAEILDPTGAVVASAESCPVGTQVVVPIREHELRLWSIDEPHLYQVRATVFLDGTPVDLVEKRFGFRTFTSAAGRFLLNGQPLLLKGVLDQDYHEAPGVLPSDIELRDRFRAVKAMGFNCLRCHIKIPDPRYLEAADEVGLLLWCELPSTSRLSPRARERLATTLEAMVARDRHHPSIVIWTIVNEDWGFDLVGQPEHRAWLRQLFREVKATVDDRLIVDNSPCAPNFHVETDIEDYHFYAVIPEMRERWDRFLDSFVARDGFTFSPDVEHPPVDRPLVVSEFGAWGLPDLSDLEDDEPWWFESGQEWADGAAYVHGAQQRYALWHLDTVFGSWNNLCLETQRRQFETLRYQIESMRLRPEIAGYVLTELTDVFWEANGLFDMLGRPRSFTDRLSALNDPVTVIARTETPTTWSGRSADIDVSVIGAPEATCQIAVRHDVSEGSAAPIAVVGERDDALRPQRFKIEVPTLAGDQGTSPVAVDVECSAVVDNRVLATTSCPLLVFPRPDIEVERGKPTVVRDEVLAQRFEAMGYDVTDRSDPVSLRVLRRLTSDDVEFIEAGGQCLVLADDVDALGPGFGEFPRIELQTWRDALFGGGEWVTAFSWLRRTGRFADLPGGPIMDSFFEGLRPSVVIRGIPPARFAHDVYAGVFVGWVHQLAAIVARHPQGLGSVVVSTLGLTGQPVDDNPVADWLLRQLIATAREQP